jgi:putative transposase
MPYLWRKLTPEQREELLQRRMELRRPWHSPPHRGSEVPLSYHITAACFEHMPRIGFSAERMEEMCAALLDVFETHGAKVHAWCVLPNHYHALVFTGNVLEVLDELGRMHGRLSFAWNGEEKQRGRKVWYGAVEREMRGERHFWATMNYIHHNPVRHRYVRRWQDWPYGSAVEFLQRMDRKEVETIWKKYPLLDYGKGWDEPDL